MVVDAITSALPQVYKLWIGVSKGMLPVKHQAPTILKIMPVNYCGHQLAQRLGWAAPANHRKEGATPHPGACKFSLQYDRRPDEGLGVRVWTWNFGSLSGKVGEACEELRKRMIDVCCQQESAGCYG